MDPSRERSDSLGATPDETPERRWRGADSAAPKRLLERRGMRALLAAAVGLLVMSLACEALWAMFAARAVRAAMDGHSIAIFNRWGAGLPRQRFDFTVRDLHADLHTVELLMLASWFLALFVWLGGRVWRRPILIPLVFIGWWVAVELLVVPWMNFRTWTLHYYIVQDVDHRPTARDGEFNSDSLVATPESSSFLPQDLNLIFLGDSFTMGVRLDDHSKAFPGLVGAALARQNPSARIHTANFGWVSSSPLLSYRRLVDVGAKYSPDIVVLSVDMTDFQDDLRYERMLERRGIYWFYDKLPLALHFLQEFAPTTYRKLASMTLGNIPDRRYFISDAPLEKTRKWMQPVADNAAKIDAWCRSHGAQFVLVVLPRGYQYSSRESPANWEMGEYEILGPYCLEPFRFFDELRAKVSFPIVSLLPDFQATQVFPTCYDNDPHYNSAGHRIAAEAIARALEPLVQERLGR
jgi:hypothetical protein